MSENVKKHESPVDRLKTESARQRWELFHRAIAHAKESNNASQLEADSHGADVDSRGPVLTIIR
jgi:hypothetical protein